MKIILIFLTLITFSLSVYFTYDRFERRGVFTMRSFDGLNEQEFSAKGTIIFNDSETVVESISPNGFMKYRKNDLKLNVTSKQRHIVYQLSDGGAMLNVNDSAGKQVLASAIKAILETGYDARGRGERLYKKGGVSALMAATSTMQQDYVKTVYFDFLINTDSLSGETVLAILTQTASIQNDFEKAKLLHALVGRLRDSTSTARFIEVAGGIKTDFEKANVLKDLLKNPLDSAGFGAVLKICAGIDADHEKSQVLKQAARQTPLTHDRINRILTVAKDLHNDFEKGNILRSFSAALITDSLTIHACLQVVSGMESDFEKTQTLEILVKQPMGDSAFQEVVMVADDLHPEHEKAGLLAKMLDRNDEKDLRIARIVSLIHNMNDDPEKANLLKKIANRNTLSGQNWVALIAEAGELGNDTEKSNLLIHIAGRMPHNEETQTAYTRAAKTINSEMDYGRALKANE